MSNFLWTWGQEVRWGYVLRSQQPLLRKQHEGSPKILCTNRSFEVKYKDQEIDIKKIVITHCSREEGAMPCSAWGAHNEAPGSVRGWGRWRTVSKRLYCGFHVDEWVKLWGRGASSLGPASLNNFRGLWGIGTVPGCCYQALGVTRAGKWSPRVWAPMKEVAVA